MGVHMAEPFYTVGHSNRTISEFVALLKDADISLVVDVRSIPKSRGNPQYNRTSFHGLLRIPDGVCSYAALGGRRARSRAVLADVNAFGKTRAFHNYADYAMSDEFHRA